jgi:hypothetical protein
VVGSLEPLKAGGAFVSFVFKAGGAFVSTDFDLRRVGVAIIYNYR